MGNAEIMLDTKLVGDIEGHFSVPSYQRGYRWGEPEVVRLLDDIYTTDGKRNYCLQPVVVRKNGEKFEVIDGQQRLTTIYLIYTEILRQYFINHPQSIDKYTFLQNSAFTHWVKEKCSKMC